MSLTPYVSYVSYSVRLFWNFPTLNSILFNLNNYNILEQIHTYIHSIINNP
jgi:hypothetical protein